MGHVDKDEYVELERQLAALERDWYQRGIDVAPGAYPWVPYPLIRFSHFLAVAMEFNSGPMVDLGAGIGTKVLMAKAMGTEAYGVENNQTYLQEAERLGASVSEGDVRSFDVTPYGIVYTYHPLHPEVQEAWYEGHLMASMKPGTVFICPKITVWPGEGWKILADWKHQDVVAQKL